MGDKLKKRITFKRARPNPLFQEWLEELYREAKEKNSKLESRLKLALDSLSKYTLPLQTGADCIILKGFEKKLCMHLDNRLEVYKFNLALASSSKASSTCSSVSNDRNRNCSSPMSDINQNIDTRSSQPQNGISKKYGSYNCQPYNSTSNVEAHSEEADHNQETDHNADSNSHSPINNVKRKKNGGKKYTPAYRSGAYALLIALIEDSLKNPGENSFTKEELIDKATKHSEESFIRSKPGTFYTAWSNMSTLVKKGLVKKKVKNKKVKYLLTADGAELAKKILEDNKTTPTVNDIIFKNQTLPCFVNLVRDKNVINKETEALSQNKSNTVIELPGASFDIILLIDKNETGGLSKKNDPTVAQFNKYPDLKHEYRSLKVGDFTWVARHKITNQELVLPYIIERKRMDDLGASIKDGRYHEQKFRLRKCGLNNVIYMVENYGSNKQVGLPIQHLMQALANTRILDGFKVHLTASLTDSARFLAMMTKRLTIRYKDKHLKGRNDDADSDYLMTFEYFNKSSAKTKPLTVTETFIKLLLQLKGVSIEKAVAITDKYSTPKSLIVAYQKCDRNEGENLLAGLKYGGLGRNVGPAVSKSIYKLFSQIVVDD